MAKRKKPTAAEESQPEQARANRPKDPSKSRAGKASDAVRKAKREAGESIARPCQAHRTDGTPCKNSAIRGGLVCSRHGGNAPQVREAANRRLLEMVEPALRELRRIVTSQAATDADKLRAISMVLSRTGFAEKQTVDVAFRQPSPFELLQNDAAITIDRSDLDELEGGGGPGAAQSRRSLR